MDSVLTRGLRPEPGLHRRDHVGALDTTKLGLPGDVPLGTLINLVELSDPLEREMGLGVIGRGFLELAEHVCPAAG